MPSPVHPYSDYGVALRTLRSARGWLAFMLFACVTAQFIGFAIMWWTPQPYTFLKGRWIDEPPATSRAVIIEPFLPETKQSHRLNIHEQWNAAYTMAVPVTQLAGLIAISSQAIIIFVTLMVILIAQAPGVAQITRSFIWSILVLFMFLPWQYFAHDFPIPGVIYSYNELLNLIGPHVAGDKVYRYEIWIVYGRFLVWPLVGLFALLITAERYRAGVMIAIGHPLQSIFQPRSGVPMPAPAVKPRPLAPKPIGPQT